MLKQKKIKNPGREVWSRLYKWNSRKGELQYNIDHANYKAGDKAGHNTALGYGKVCFQNRKYMTRRVVWEMFYDLPVPKGYDTGSTSPYHHDDCPEKLFLWSKRDKKGYIADENGQYREMGVEEWRKIIRERTQARIILGLLVKE